MRERERQGRIQRLYSDYSGFRIWISQRELIEGELIDCFVFYLCSMIMYINKEITYHIVVQPFIIISLSL